MHLFLGAPRRGSRRLRGRVVGRLLIWVICLTLLWGPVAAKEDVVLMGVPATSFSKSSDRALLVYSSTTRHPPTHVKAVSWLRYLPDKQDFDLKKGFVTKWIGADEKEAKALEDGERFRALSVVPGSYALQSIITLKDGKMRRIHAKQSTQVINLEAGRAYFLNDIVFKWQMKNVGDRPDHKVIRRDLTKWLQIKTEYKIEKLLQSR